MTRITLALTILSLCGFTAPLQAQSFSGPGPDPGPDPDPDPAIQRLRDALQVCEPADEPCRDVGLNNLGEAEDRAGRKQEALGHYDELLELKRKRGDRVGEAATLTHIGAVYSGLGDRKKAMENYEQALALYRQVGDRGGEAATIDSIGSTYDELGDKVRALQHYQQALALYRQVGDRSGEAITLININRWQAVAMARLRDESPSAPVKQPSFLHARSFVEFGGVGFLVPLSLPDSNGVVSQTTVGMGGVGVHVAMLFPTFHRPLIDGGVTLQFGDELTFLSGSGGLLYMDALWVGLGYDLGISDYLQIGPRVGVGLLTGQLQSAAGGQNDISLVDGMALLGGHVNLWITPSFGIYFEADATNLLREDVWGSRLVGGFAIAFARKRAH